MNDRDIQNLEFTPWHPWDKRKSISRVRFPGVYLIRITNSDLIDDSPARICDACYIGMTNSKGGLAGRLNQFNTTITIEGKKDHNPATRIRRDRGLYGTWNERLYVAVMAIECNVEKPNDEDYMKMGWVTFLEYEAFAQYYREHQSLPRYNTKTKPPILDTEP